MSIAKYISRFEHYDGTHDLTTKFGIINKDEYTSLIMQLVDKELTHEDILNIIDKYALTMPYKESLIENLFLNNSQYFLDESIKYNSLLFLIISFYLKPTKNKIINILHNIYTLRYNDLFIKLINIYKRDESIITALLNICVELKGILSADLFKANMLNIKNILVENIDLLISKHFLFKIIVLKIFPDINLIELFDIILSNITNPTLKDITSIFGFDFKEFALLKDSEEFDCSISFSNEKMKFTLQCNHDFGPQILYWIFKNGTCPTCRASITLLPPPVFKSCPEIIIDDSIETVENTIVDYNKPIEEPVFNLGHYIFIPHNHIDFAAIIGGGEGAAIDNPDEHLGPAADESEEDEYSDDENPIAPHNPTGQIHYPDIDDVND
jgi:hypothetical protein